MAAPWGQGSMLVMSLIGCGGERQLSVLQRNRSIRQAARGGVYSGVKLRYLVKNQFRTSLKLSRFQGVAKLLEVIFCGTKIVLTY